MALKELIDKLAKEFENDGYFGFFGSTEQNQLVEKLEARLKVKLPDLVRQFIKEYGSLQLGNVCVDFVPNGMFPGCIEWTEEMRQKYPYVASDLIAILQDEGCYYLLECSTGKIYVWDPFCEPIKDDFYRVYENLEELIEAMAEWARKRRAEGII